MNPGINIRDIIIIIIASITLYTLINIIRRCKERRIDFIRKEEIKYDLAVYLLHLIPLKQIKLIESK